MALIRMIGGKDYTQRLKNQLLASIALLAVGVIGIVCYFVVVPGSGLADFARGFYIGGASGITAGAVILLGRCAYLLKHPKAYEKARVKDTDERSQAILHKSFEAAGTVTFFVSAAVLFVVLPFSVEAFRALMGTMILFALTFLAANVILERRM